MNSIERRLEPRRPRVKAWDDQLREAYRSVEAAVVRDIQPHVCCPRCRGEARPMEEKRATVDWYRCAACANLWAVRSAHLV